MGYALGALVAGVASDALGYGGAISLIAVLTAASGVWVLADMPARRSDPGDAAASRSSEGVAPASG
jgi:predicted MFS family arabinose efflux permease